MHALDIELQRKKSVLMGFFMGTVAGVLFLTVVGLVMSLEVHGLEAYDREVLARNTYPAKVIRVIDADTYEALVYTFRDPALVLHTSVRVYGVDTPEHGWRASCDKERELAEKASVAVERWFGVRGDQLVVTQVQSGKYSGRILATTVDKDGKSLAQFLMDGGFAVEYFGRGARHDWCK